jgi:4-azaleucine resistance transporter AzlC
MCGAGYKRNAISCIVTNLLMGVFMQHTFWPAFRSGFLAVIPLWVGAAPFGAIYAVSALAAGLNPAQTLAMSLIVFAGAAQFTAAGLFAAGAAPLTIIITTLIVNARHVLMGASIAPHLRGVPAWMRGLIAFQLTDETYAVGIQRYLNGNGSAAYQIGANMSMYVIWQTSTIAGMLIGSAIPDPAAYGLDLVFPLTFVGLLVPLLKTRISTGVAVIATILSLLGALFLPGKWYILLAGVVASGLGMVLEALKQGNVETGRVMKQYNNDV